MLWQRESETRPAVSSTRLFIEAARRVFPTTWNALRDSWSALFLLGILQGGAGQFFAYAMDLVRSSGREDLLLIGVIAVLELVFTLVWSGLWLLTICTSLTRTETQEELKFFPRQIEFFSDFNHLMIEQMRSLASVLWRAPLLIIPAIIEYVRLTFVPLVVVLDPKYRLGGRDALRMSRLLSRGHFMLISLTLIVSAIVPWIIDEMVHGNDGPFIWENPLGVSASWVLTLLIEAFASVFLLELFRGLLKRMPENSAVQDFQTMVRT